MPWAGQLEEAPQDYPSFECLLYAWLDEYFTLAPCFLVSPGRNARNLPGFSQESARFLPGIYGTRTHPN